MKNIFAPGGLLARHLPSYEVRTGQQEMAEAVAALLAREIEDEGQLAACLLMEAETGLGKTLAYLLPSVLSGRKVVVSTNTLTLQDQILTKEIPFIRKHIAPDLKAVCVKGRQNYLCLYRWQQLQGGGQQELFAEHKGLKTLAAWLQKTRFADRAELPFLAGNSPLWQRLSCQASACLGSNCPEGSRCYLNRLRREAAAADLLLVNHHLLFSDLAVRDSGLGEVLPRYESVIFDEAHHLEDIASAFFGRSFSTYQVLDFLNDLQQVMRQETGPEVERIRAAASSLLGLNTACVACFSPQRGRFPLLFNEAQAQALMVLRAALDDLSDRLEQAEGYAWEHQQQRCQGLSHCLDFITGTAVNPDHVRWLERTEKNLTLSATPIEVAPDFQRTLLRRVQHCIFTSATLRSNADLGYFSRRLGLPPESKGLAFPSPFDYPKQSLIYVPDQGFPEPQQELYRQHLHETIRRLLTLSRGRALVLFTSFQALEAAWQALADQLDYPLLRQGSRSRVQLLHEFSQETASVLFAVASFWEGVDVPGESLSLVIIDKLPFEVPSDPVVQARLERIQAAGGNPFFDLQVPKAILLLRQGVGRLLRRSTDRGVLALLDVRLFTKSYGRLFINSLPPAPVTRSLTEVQNFFTPIPHHEHTRSLPQQHAARNRRHSI